MKNLLYSLLLLPFFGSMQATAQGNCQANFQWSTASCPTLDFFDSSYADSSDQIASWSWYFGDGNTSTSMSPSNTYASNGSYAVCLTIQTSGGCSSSFCDTIDISCIGQSSCDALFTTDSSVCPTVGFIDLSTSNTSTVEWYYDFGDGNTSTSQNPTHTFTSNGTYQVCLTTVSSDSCVDTYCQNVSITCLGGQQNCQAAFTTDSSICPTVGFIDISSSNTQATGWSWAFGDGNTSTSQNPTHTYTANGQYLVCLTTIFADSCVSTYCDYVTISCLGGQTGCQAAFTTDSSVCPTVGFIDLSTSNTSTVEWYYDFGDGNTSTSQNPTHTFASNGVYTVCLTTVSSDSCTSTYCQTVLVSCLASLNESILDNVVLSPNPAQNVVNLSLGQSNALEYQIIGLNGQVYDQGMRGASQTHSFDIFELESGMYLMNIQVGESQKVIRFIKK